MTGAHCSEMWDEFLTHYQATTTPEKVDEFLGGLSVLSSRRPRAIQIVEDGDGTA